MQAEKKAGEEKIMTLSTALCKEEALFTPGTRNLFMGQNTL